MGPNEEKNHSVYFVFSEKETCEKLSKIFGIQYVESAKAVSTSTYSYCTVCAVGAGTQGDVMKIKRDGM